MKRNILLILTVATAAILIANERKYPHGWEHSDPPPGDDFLTNRFGRTWSDPIYTGYLLVDDHYVDAPYIVEQRGFVILVNGERVEDGVDIRCVLPLPPPPAVTNDPGMPPGITRETRASAAVSHPIYMARKRYFDHLGLVGEARAKAEKDMLLRLPCVSNIVALPDRGAISNRYMVYDYSGNRFGTRFHSDCTPPPPTYEDTNSFTSIVRLHASMGALLSCDNFVHIRNGGLVGHESAPLCTNMWRECFEVMANTNMTPAERFTMLHTKGYFKQDSLETLRGAYPFDGFRPTPQLWQRLSGDMSWTNDAPARLLALTNGWQKILPAFMRAQAVVATVGDARTKPEAPTNVAASHVASPMAPSHTTNARPVKSTAVAVAGTKPGAKAVWAVAILVVVLPGLFLLARRLRRK